MTMQAQKNRYEQIAGNNAIEVKQLHFKQSKLERSARYLRIKYHTLLGWTAGHKVVYFLALPAHLIAAILGGISIAPVLSSFETLPGELVTHADWLRSWLPIGILYFLSLAFGLFAYHIKLKRDQIVPNKIKFEKSYLLGATFVLLIYGGLITQVIQMGIVQAEGDYHARVKLIGWLSLAELVIGVVAHRGWTLLIVSLQLIGINIALNKCRKRILRARQNSELYIKYSNQLMKPENFTSTEHTDRKNNA